MSEEQVQAPVQTAMDMALAIAKSELGEDKPRDEQGRFTKEESQEAAPEAPAQEAQPETEAAQEEATETQPPVEQPETTPEIRRFKLKYKGEELEKEEPEVIALAQQGFDYTQKAQALAREREELENTVKSRVEPKLKEYETQLEMFKQTVLKLADPEALSADLNKLAAEDPARAFQLSLKRDEIQRTLSAIAAEQHKVHMQRQEEQRFTLQKQAREAVEALQRDIPNWSNELYGKILKTGQEYGFKPDEVGAITDPRAIKVLNDARQWREFKAAKPQAAEKKKVEVPKVAKPGTAEKPDPNADKWKQGMEALKKSGGNWKQATGLAMQLLEREG